MTEPTVPQSTPPPLEKQPIDPFHEAVQRGIQVALDQIRTQYESLDDLDDKLFFHDSIHTNRVIERVQRLATAINEFQPKTLSDHDIAIATLIAGWHDIIQASGFFEETRPGGFPKQGRRAKIGDNEHNSAAELIGYMTAQNDATDTELFTANDMQMVRDGMTVTIPSFTPTGEVWQDHLKPDSPLMVRLIALADLGGAGIDGPDSFKHDGNGYFWELNPDITRAVYHNTSLEDGLKDDYRARMIGWLGGQATFATYRLSRLDAELEGLEPALADHIKSTVLRPETFAASIRMAETRAEQANSQTYEELVATLGVTASQITAQ